MSSNLDRALAYLGKLPMAVDGSGGHHATFQAALACRRLGLTSAEMWEAMQWFNSNRCSPPWSEKELQHKVADATDLHVKKPLAQRGYRSKVTVKPITAAQLADLSAQRRARKVAVPAVRVAPILRVSDPDEWPSDIEDGAWVDHAPPPASPYQVVWCGAHLGEMTHWPNQAGELVCSGCHPPVACW